MAKFHAFCVLFYALSTHCDAQWDKMNRKELESKIDLFTEILDSLRDHELDLILEKSNWIRKNQELKFEQAEKESELSILIKKEVELHQNEKILQERNDYLVNKINILQDNIDSLKQIREKLYTNDRTAVLESLTSRMMAQSSDAKNGHSTGLSDGAYSMILYGIIANGNNRQDIYYYSYGDWDDDDEYSSNEAPPEVEYAPELIPIQLLDVVYVNSRNGNKRQLSTNEFMSLLPRIQIFKSKFIRFDYHNETNEDFVYNIEISPENNGRFSLDLKMGNEAVEDGQKDMIWPIQITNKKVVIALSCRQLKRLGVPILINSYEPEGIRFSRKKEQYTLSNADLSMEHMTYLFVLNADF
jgi:hypothetical protein